MNERNVLENIKYGFFKGDFSEYYYADHLSEMNMVKVKGKFRLAACFLVSIVFLTSCATTPPMEDVVTPVAGETIVFGRVDVFENGVKQEWKMKWTGVQAFYLMILPSDTSQALTYKVKPDGTFNWSLKPGKYMLLAYRFQKGSQRLIGHIASEFDVPDGVEGLYIGDVQVNIKKGRYLTTFVDNYDTAVAQYKSKFAMRAVMPVKGIMKEKQKLGSYALVGYQCHERWGIKCTDRYSGVTPVSPEIANQGFPQTDSLSPLFKWQPSSKQRITYDFVVYEAASYSVSGMDRQYLEGRLVAYKENIKDPFLKLKEPLSPKTKYYWSVRMRDGDKVSRWSSFSYKSFLIFAITSGYGKSFVFSTP